MNLSDFLIWLATSAGASSVASWVLERIPKYAALASAEAKRWIFFGVCAVLSCGSYAIITYVPSSVLQSLAPWFGLIASTFASIFIGTSFHKVDKLDK
jgi:Na+/proline symporter